MLARLQEGEATVPIEPELLLTQADLEQVQARLSVAGKSAPGTGP